MQDAWSSALPVAIGEISCHERASCCICRRRAALCADCSSAKGVCHGAVEARVVEGGVHIRVGACGLYGFCCDSGLSAVKGALALRRLTRWGSCAKRLSPAKGACAQREPSHQGSSRTKQITFRQGASSSKEDAHQGRFPLRKEFSRFEKSRPYYNGNRLGKFFA